MIVIRSVAFWGFLLSVMCFSAYAETSPTTLRLGLLLANNEHGASFRNILKKFEQAHPGIHVELHPYNDADYKTQLQHWLEVRQGPDVLYWQGGERLFNLVRKGAVKELTDLWQSARLYEAFPLPLQSLVTFQQTPYAVPFAYYQWGFYYRKSVFNRFHLSPPQTWDDFLQVVKTLDYSGRVPIAIGTAEHWTAAAWFDYFNLRLNGLTFHQALLRGEVSFLDQRVMQALHYWQTLIKTGAFPKNHPSLSWQDAMPYLYRDKAGMTLMGNFVEQQIPEQLREDIGYFPFPQINAHQPRYELMPTEVWFIADWARNINAAEKLLSYLAQPEVQYQLAEKLGYIAANQHTPPPTSELSREGSKLLAKTQGTMQYLDRDSNQAFAAHAVSILSGFLTAPDIEQTAHALESKRYLLNSQPSH